MVGGFSKLRSAGALHVLIALNTAVLAVVAVGNYFTDGSFTAALALPSGALATVSHPWTPVTYMFVQADVLHLLFNMLWLYCFGRIMLQFASGRSLWLCYLGGGLVGALAFVAVYALVPALGTATLMGASSAVIAVAVAVAFEVPDMQLNVWPLGPVRVKWIVVAMVALFCVGLTGSVASNVAHAGGAVFGVAFGMRGRVSGIVGVRGRSRADMRAELDVLLDKVRVSGYNALSSRDKKRLFELSHKVKKQG